MEDGANSFYYINVFTHLKRGQGICTIIILTKSCVFSDCLKYIFLKQPLKHEDGQKFVPWARIFAHWNMPIRPHGSNGYYLPLYLKKSLSIQTFNEAERLAVRSGVAGLQVQMHWQCDCHTRDDSFQ